MNVKDFFLFEGLDEKRLKRLREITASRNCSKGQILFSQGDEPRNLHILTSGILKVFKIDPKGNEVVLNHFYPVMMVAELVCIEGIRYPASAVFETDGSVMSIDYKIFEQEFLKAPEISFQIIKSLTKKLMTLDRVISRSLTMSASGKVARFIYENEDLFHQLKHNKVASILNITPETMSRVIRKLKDSGAIDRGEGGYCVKDKRRLEEFFDEPLA